MFGRRKKDALTGPEALALYEARMAEWGQSKVEWITSAPGLVETYPIIPARQALPQWFKDSERRIGKDSAHGHGMPGPMTSPLGPMPPGAPMPPPPPPAGPKVGPPSYWPDESPTIRYCPGVIDVMRSGYLLRAWTDIEISTPEPPAPGTGKDGFRDRTGMHPQDVGGKIGAFGPGLNQRIPLHPGEYDFALKLDSPWVCKTPPGWSLLYLPMPYEEKKPFRILHGITDNDTFHIVNLLAMWSHYGTYLIEAGTPLCWLLPVKREGFNFKTEVRYDPEYDKVLRAVGKGGVGNNNSRLIHGSYVLERAKSRKAKGEAE